MLYIFLPYFVSPLQSRLVGVSYATVSKFFENFNELKINGQLKDQKFEGYMKFAPSENMDDGDGPSHISPSTFPMSNLLKQAKAVLTSTSSQAKVGASEIANVQQVANSQPSILAQFQAKEADVQALSKLTHALEKKVSSALFCLRQRNMYQGNSLLTWMKPIASLGDPGGLSNSFDCYACHTLKIGSHVVEIVESSRTTAQTMVDAAMQGKSHYPSNEKRKIKAGNIDLEDYHRIDPTPNSRA